MLQLTLILALATLATARVTRIITSDRITRPLRQRAVKRWGATSMRAYLMHCPHCIAFWLSAATAVLLTWQANITDTLNLTTWLTYPLTWLTIAYLSGIIVAHETSNE